MDGKIPFIILGTMPVWLLVILYFAQGGAA